MGHIVHYSALEQMSQIPFPWTHTIMPTTPYQKTIPILLCVADMLHCPMDGSARFNH